MRHGTIESWRATMMTLADRVFYDLIHNYLGEIPSPHHKPELLARLEQLMLSDDFRTASFAFLDGLDHYLLGMVRWLDGVVEDELYPLVQSVPGLERYHDFHQRIVNLEDRLFLYQEHESRLLQICPLLAAGLATGMATGPISSQARNDPQAWLGDGLFLALIAAWPQLAHNLKNDGTLGKKGREQFLRLFAGLGDYEGTSGIDPELGDLCLHALRQLGLVRNAGNSDQPVAVPERIQAFFNLDPESRLHLFLAAAIGEGSDDPFRQQNLLRERATALRDFLDHLGDDEHQTGDLERIWQGLCFRRQGRTEAPRPLQGTLQALGLLKPGSSAGAWKRCRPAPASAREALRLNAAGIIHACEPDCATLAPLLCVLELERFGHDTVYRLEHRRCREAFARGLEPATLLQRLQDASRAPVPQSLAFQIQEWATEAGGVRLSGGLLLECRGEHRAAVEALASAQPLVRLLDTGLYFVPVAALELIDRLVEHGLCDQVAVDRARGAGGDDAPDILPPLRALAPASAPAPLPLPSAAARRAGEITVKLFHAIESRPWTSEQKAEARSRVEQGLIIHPSQLASPPRLSEQGRAQGLDFNAKVRLVEEAIRHKNEYLGLRILGSNDPGEMLVWPKQVKGHGQDALLCGQSLPGHQDLVLYIRKIIEVRRVRASLFP